MCQDINLIKYILCLFHVKYLSLIIMVTILDAKFLSVLKKSYSLSCFNDIIYFHSFHATYGDVRQVIFGMGLLVVVRLSS